MQNTCRTGAACRMRERSLGRALRMEASEAPSMSQEASTSHSAIWWRSSRSARSALLSGTGSPPARARTDSEDGRRKTPPPAISAKASCPARAPPTVHRTPAECRALPIAATSASLSSSDPALSYRLSMTALYIRMTPLATADGPFKFKRLFSHRPSMPDKGRRLTRRSHSITGITF